MSGKKIIVDTSVWIDYFKGADADFGERVDEVLTHSVVCVPKVIIAELIQGAKTEKEISVIEEFIDAFTLIDQTESSWLKAGRLSFTMKRKGISVHLVDCYIAVLASEHGCGVFTLDKHFHDIKKFLKIEVL